MEEKKREETLRKMIMNLVFTFEYRVAVEESVGNSK